MQIIGANWRVVTCYLILPKQTPKNLLKKIKSKGIETSKCVLNKLLKINIEIKKMKEEICLLFFFSRSFLLRIKLVLMSLYHFRWIFSFGFFLLLLLLLLYSGLLSHVIGIFKSFSFIVFLFFSPLVPFDIANSTQLLQYSYGYNEKKKKHTKKFDYHINLLDYLQDLYTYSMILNVFTYVSN